MQELALLASLLLRSPAPALWIPYQILKGGAFLLLLYRACGPHPDPQAFADHQLWVVLSDCRLAFGHGQLPLQVFNFRHQRSEQLVVSI